MAEAKTNFVLEANPGQVIDALLKINNAQDGTISQLRKMNREGKDTAQALVGAFTNVANMLGVGGGIAGGLTFLMGQTAAWSEETKQLAQKFKDVNKELLLAISRSGDLANSAEIQKKLRTSVMPGVGPAERTDIYRALRAEMPMEDIGTIMELMTEAAKAKIFEEPKDFAGRIGMTHHLYGGRLTAGDVSDVTKIAGDMLGANAEKYGTQVFKQAMQLQASGMNPDKALAMMIAAAEQGQLKGAGTLTGLLTTEKFFERKPGQKLSTKEKIEREFYAIEDPQKRLEWLMANQGKGGRAAAVLPEQGVLAALSQADIDKIAGNIRKAREVNYFEKSRQLAIGTQPGNVLLILEEAKASVAEEEARSGGKLAETDIARDLLRIAYLRRARRYGAQPIAYIANKAILETAMFLGVSPKTAVTNLLPIVWGTTSGPISSPPMSPALLKQEIEEAFRGKTLPEKDIQELTRAIKDLTVIVKNRQNRNAITISPDSGMVD